MGEGCVSKYLEVLYSTYVSLICMTPKIGAERMMVFEAANILQKQSHQYRVLKRVWSSPPPTIGSVQQLGWSDVSRGEEHQRRVTILLNRIR